MREIGEVAAVLMDVIEEEFGPDVEIGTVAVVVEVNTGSSASEFRVACDDSRAWVQRALLAEAQQVVEDWEADLRYGADEEDEDA